MFQATQVQLMHQAHEVRLENVPSDGLFSVAMW